MDLNKSKIPNPKSQSGESPQSGDSPADYCRQIEAYLCRKNDGHLIRIVGPSFEKVCGWADRGVPMAVAFRGIDRSFDRYYAKGPRRRPLRIDFCEADVLDVFDEWRRAVGVPRSADEGEDPTRRHESLPAHLERVIARLTALRARSLPPEGGSRNQLLDDIIRELDEARASAKGLRGAARAEFLARLAVLDARLLTMARDQLTNREREQLRDEAERELAPFRARMPRAAFELSLAACADRLLRDRARVPVLTLE